MADLAGSLISLRIGATPTLIKVTRGEYDSETGHNRAITSELGGAPRTVITSKGGKISIEGFYYKDATILTLHGAPTASGFRVLTDSGDASAHTIHFPDSGGNPGTQILNFRWTGDCSAEGMQTFTCDFHSNYGSVMNTTITG